MMIIIIIISRILGVNKLEENSFGKRGETQNDKDIEEKKDDEGEKE